MTHSHEHESEETHGGACGGSGCGCAASSAGSGDGHDDHDHSGGLGAVITAGVATGLGMLGDFLWPEALWGYGFYLTAVVAGGWLVVPHAWASIRRGRLDMNVLMTIAVAGALGIGEWVEAATVVFLFSLSEWLEGVSVRRAKRAVAKLMELAPDTALVVDAKGGTSERQVAEVSVDDVVRVRSGSRVPLDGVVLEGRSSVDQSPITGESIPVEKQAGDEVFAGTINGEGSMEVRVTSGAGESTLARMVRLVEEAQASRAPTQRFVDRFAQIYTPSVVVLAVLLVVVPTLFNGDFSLWFYRALVLLVIACPCALVIATPISMVSGLTALARRGVLVKGGAALEAVGKLQALAVDKTGTITQGKPKVVEVHALPGHDEAEVLRVAAAIDSHSTHPLAMAVVAAADERGVAWSPGADYRSTGGRGAEALVEGHPYFVGNHLFTHEAGVCSPEIETRLAAIEERANSVVVVGHRPHQPEGGAACVGGVMGILAVRDVLRPEVPEALAALHKAGVRPVVMLSGDNQRTASAIAQEAGIDEAQGDLLPEQKIERLRELMTRHGAMGMVGDGVNDAPALAAATVGIAMGQGTATALETADIALLNNDLRKVAEAVDLGRRTLRMIKGNIAFALGIKLLFLLLAALGHASLWMAVLADTGATLLVIAFSLTLLRNPNASS